jgi:hypothetical protein
MVLAPLEIELSHRRLVIEAKVELVEAISVMDRNLFHFV